MLEARGLPYDLIERDQSWALCVAAAMAPAAAEELTRYTAERSVRRPLAPPLLPFPGGAEGAIGFTAVLLLVSYCAGIRLFGADWYVVGALARSAPGGLDVWRAVTALTLHVDAQHLLGNLLFGTAVGVIVSSMFGPGVAWASILAAGACGNYLEMLIAPVDHHAIGASTAVFAALGLLSGFGWRRQLTLRERWLHRWAPLIAGICLLTLLGVGSEHVDVLGHLLGFLAGVALGWIYARAELPRSRSPALQAAAAAAAITVLVLSWTAALRHAG